MAKTNENKRAWGVAQLVDYLPSGLRVWLQSSITVIIIIAIVI
jgi:hypothetical protein